MTPLLKEDLLNPVWIRIRDHYIKRLADLRAKNDNRLDADETARLRGRILEVKSILGLESTQAPPESDDT